MNLVCKKICPPSLDVEAEENISKSVSSIPEPVELNTVSFNKVPVSGKIQLGELPSSNSVPVVDPSIFLKYWKSAVNA